MKILQIVESLDKGAVENWLVRTFIEVSKQRPDWSWTFFCVLDKPGSMDSFVIENGGEVILSKYPLSKKIKFLNNLGSIIKENQFNIIHAHHDYLNAFYLMAFLQNSAYKISQIHNTDKHLPIRSRFINKLLIPILRLINNVGYNKLVGVSSETILEFKIFKKKTANSDILTIGIDLERFKKKYDRNELLEKHNLPSNSLVLLYIGRFTKLKNPSFLVDILFELHSRETLPFYSLFIGEGNELDNIYQKAVQLNILDKIRISGWDTEPEKYFQIANLFIFPRRLKPTEGFGLVMLEAQASGIHTIVSKGVLQETININEIVHVMNNIISSKQWADKILEVYSKGHLLNALQIMEKSDFNIKNSTKRLIQLYENR
jgi:glycosyltransferase involved in cell wall biosynthesis